MAFKKIYKGQFSNAQTYYPDNSDNSQDVFVSIYDKAHEAAANPYGIEFSAVETNPGINITINLTINSDTSNYSNVSVEASADGSTWTEVLTQANPVEGQEYINLVAFDTYTQYLVKFTLISPPDEEVVYIQEDVEISLDMAETPVLSEVIDTDEDKFTPIRSRQVKLQLHTSNDIDIMTFTSGGDNDFYCEIAVGTEANVVFNGWLSVEDINQEFQPHPNMLVLTVTDGLGFLKDEPLTDLNGDIFTGENKIIDYLTACFAKTGRSLQLIAEMNIREKDAGLTDAGHFYNYCYLHSGTFESAPNEFDDCYTVLEKILGESCELSLQKNKWYIKRIDEFDVQDNKQCLFNADGTIQGFLTDARYEKNIGADNSQYTLAFMNDDAVISRTRPLKSVKHIFNYVVPEIPCNASFERGDFIADLGNEVIDGVTYSVKKFELSCWSLLKDVEPPTHPDPATINEVFIKRWYNSFGEETFKDVVITYPEPYPNASRLECTPIYMGKGDNFDLSYQFKYSQDISGGNANFLQCHIRLEGDDDSVWFYEDNDSSWHLSDNIWTGIRTISKNWTPDDIDETEWQSLSVEVGKLPVNGKIIIAVYWGNISDLSGIDLHIQDFRVTYRAYIDESYIAVKGHYHLSEQSGNYNGKREKEVFISDAPKKLFKGVLMKLVSGEYVLTEGFWNFAVFPGGVPSSDYIKPFGEMQNQDVWNQYNRPMTVIDATIDGLDTDKTDLSGRIDIPDLMHTFFVKDSHPATNNRQFKLLHCSQDFDLCQCDIYLCEVLNETIAKQYTGHTFKYVTNDRQ